MQEINEGNNIIFEAAGEEANVIFGCVRKEELNDYVSYTVIATGFDNNNKTHKSPPAKSSSRDTFRGGFTFLEDKEVDKENLDIPTIYRVKSPKTTMDQEKEDETAGGFNFETSRYNWSKDKAKKKEEEPAEEEDSSSFLRMIMD
jgi:cell division protein FtsZ